MTPYEIGLTVAVVVLGILVAACIVDILRNRALIAEMATAGRMSAECIEGLVNREQQARQKAESIAKICDEIKARLAMEPTAKAQIAELRAAVQELRSQVAGVVISREVLTPCKLSLGSRATGSVSSGSTFGFEPAHASADFDLTAPEPDPETAEAQDQADDDQATERLSIDEPPIRERRDFVEYVTLDVVDMDGDAR